MIWALRLLGNCVAVCMYRKQLGMLSEFQTLLIDRCVHAARLRAFEIFLLQINRLLAIVYAFFVVDESS